VEALRTPAERQAAFRELLRESDCRPGDNWAEAAVELAGDARFACLNAGERRQAFSEFLTRREKEEREERRRGRVAAREAFTALLHARGGACGRGAPFEAVARAAWEGSSSPTTSVLSRTTSSCGW
jgi:hypothetical protein